jgi:hypothetical protein
MNKKILLIGNSDGLPGVKKDFVNYESFFMSPIGGNWYNTEIIRMMNPSQQNLRNELKRLQSLKLDYLIVMFSGHGGQAREVVIEINEKEERIYESELVNIAERQITILDCCRVRIAESINLSDSVMMRKAATTEINTRQEYEKRIMQAIPQQVRLFACKVGETAEDTSDGGIYSLKLISAAKYFDTDYLTIGKAHSEATTNTTVSTNYRQHPDSILPKCLSSQDLIISINPRLGKKSF